jgi:hypothetical protein
MPLADCASFFGQESPLWKKAMSCRNKTLSTNQLLPFWDRLRYRLAILQAIE